ncbi:MAG: 23S rRNA (adenine(2503)-C(2))-methyltransferase RlmN [Saprospiraceae bacterium]|nr:23S rRNA (adenine(2503)-C(2))-methyltransferase RlmN [Saprospiraceae bacterium]
MTKTDIRKYGLQDLTAYFEGIGEARFRAAQVYDWLWKKGVSTFEEMTNLSQPLREKLKTHFDLLTIREDMVQHSNDGTIKIRYVLHDGHKIEAVLIPVAEEDRYTVCVSCQVGCSLTCKFCATGRMKRVRNLDAAEIVDQVMLVNRLCERIYGRKLTNIVYMGMGEPLLAYANVMESIAHITGEHCLAMSPKRITVSTAGVSKMIKKLADDDVKFNLALSLHAADDAKRNEIMPINEQNDLKSLMEAIEYFYKKTKNRVSYEYIALRGFNDSDEDAKKLIKLCRRFPVKVNIIEYNPIEDSEFDKSEEDRINTFARIVRDAGIMITVRRSRGRDIDAACGQLANK